MFNVERVAPKKMFKGCKRLEVQVPRIFNFNFWATRNSSNKKRCWKWVTNNFHYSLIIHILWLLVMTPSCDPMISLILMDYTALIDLGLPFEGHVKRWDYLSNIRHFLSLENKWYIIFWKIKKWNVTANFFEVYLILLIARRFQIRASLAMLCFFFFHYFENDLQKSNNLQKSVRNRTILVVSQPTPPPRHETGMEE